MKSTPILVHNCVTTENETYSAIVKAEYDETSQNACRYVCDINVVVYFRNFEYEINAKTLFGLSKLEIEFGDILIHIVPIYNEFIKLLAQDMKTELPINPL